MLNKEYEVIVPFMLEPWKRFAFKEIKKLSNKTSESYVYNILKKFVKKDILKQEKAGNVILYLLNISNMSAQAYAGFVAEHIAWNKKHIPYKGLTRIAAKIPTVFYTFIITGSYARNKQTEKSDIDAAILVDNSVEPKKVYAELRMECELNIPQIHLYVFKASEYLEMLLNKEANYGKEIAKNNLILAGGANYYKLIGEAILRGFNDKSLS